jgi:tetratricopeptide (TPR) repeat protein
MPETNRAVQQDVEDLSPAEYFALHRRCSESLADYKIEHLAAHLALSAWDPHIYKKVHQRICDQLDMAEPATIDYLANNMHKLAENFYYMPGTYDIFFDIAVFFHNLNRYDDAIYHYEQSANIFNPQYGLLYNLGLCYHNVGEKEKALATFKRAYEQDPDAPEAREWVEYLEAEGSEED